MNDAPQNPRSKWTWPWFGFMRWLYRETSPTAGVLGMGFIFALGAIVLKISAGSDALLARQSPEMFKVGCALLAIGFLRILFGKYLERSLVVTPRTTSSLDAKGVLCIIFFTLVAFYLLWNLARILAGS